jgi:hypothetical protein
MHMLRARSIAAPAVIVALIAWFGVSNHCALDAIARQKTISMGDCCPFHSHPIKPQNQRQSDAQPCCKILRAIVANSVKDPARIVIDLTDVEIPFAKLVVVARPKISFTSVALDTGPPGAFSFAQLVLQRSLRAHAPPFLA